MAVCRQMSGMHGSISGCMYLNLENFAEIPKQATALYVHSSLLKTVKTLLRK
jgi:hypothetical protein